MRKTPLLLFTGTTFFEFAIAFWQYGGCRTMAETVCFDLTTTMTSLFVLLFLQLPVIGIILLCTSRWWTAWKMTTKQSLASGFFLGVLMGVALSEIWILEDERDFNSELRKAPYAAYSRPRAWPFNGTALVYDPERGIHATD